ncbi:MAG: AAA family ATPase, partial [Clostridia bacterium]
RITDSQGRTIDFKNTIIILTSNLGSGVILDGIDKDGNISQSAKDEVDRLLKSTFRPEFLNRLDEIVFYKPLTVAEIGKIVDLLLATLSKRLADKQLNLTVTDKAKQYIVDNGYDAVYGARPLKRFITSNVETMVAKEILQKDPSPNTSLVVDVADEQLIILEK